MSILSILQTSLMPLALHAPLAPGASEAHASKTQETAPKDPQPVSSGPPPAPVDSSAPSPTAAKPSGENSPAPEVADQILDEETQSALVDANAGERLDMPRMSASLANALLTLNAKPSSLAHLLEGTEDGPSIVERAYSRLDMDLGRTPYSKSA